MTTGRAGPFRAGVQVGHYLENRKMLTNEMKRQVFLKLRTENYRASLRLEGLTPRPVADLMLQPVSPQRNSILSSARKL